MLLLDHSQVLLSRDLVCLGLERLVRAGALELELASWGVCERFLMLVVFTTVDFVHASHEKLEKIGAEALGTDSGLSDVIADLLVEQYYDLDCRLTYLWVSMQKSGCH